MSATSDGTNVDEELQAVVGKPMRGGPSVAPDPVNQPMIRHWAAAFDDRNPVYTDPETAAASRFGGIIAPPLMLQTWTMPTPQLEGIRERGGAPQESDGTGPLAALDRAGYTGTLATNSEYEILRPVRLGDVISSSTVIESISAAKQTRMGDSRFVTWLTTYTDQTGEVVGRQRFRIVKFGSPDGAAPGEAGA
jgi:acyl dehydratase